MFAGPPAMEMVHKGHQGRQGGAQGRWGMLMDFDRIFDFVIFSKLWVDFWPPDGPKGHQGTQGDAQGSWELPRNFEKKNFFLIFFRFMKFFT